MKRRDVVLALVGYYPPAYRAGGPTRSIPAIAEQLSDAYDFRVVTRDRDIGVAHRLAGVVSDRWTRRDSAMCLYLSPRSLGTGRLVKVLGKSRHDVLYLNSMFAFKFSLLPLLLRRVGLMPRRGLLLAPRGELDVDALAIKRARKRVVLWLVATLRLVDDALWHAATLDEAAAIRAFAGRRARIRVARDIPGRGVDAWSPPPKQADSLDIVWIGRVARIKNLATAIGALSTVRGAVSFNVYGPIEDRPYWDDCLRLVEALPPNVAVRYRGLVEPGDVPEVLARHHVFLLPTLGESYGHAIVEALVAGRPVLISDQTPWRDLEPRRAGWDVPLSQPERIAEIIQQCVDMDEAELATWAAGARALGREIVDDPTLDAAYRSMFEEAASRHPRTP